MAAIGKIVVNDFYIHLSAVGQLKDAEVRSRIEAAVRAVSACTDATPNIAKYNSQTRRVTLLDYPEFFDEPFPRLARSWVVPDGAREPTSCRHYLDSLNPPILHRKELLVGNKHPSYSQWAELTATAEAFGLFDDTRTIGFSANWDKVLREKGLQVVGHSISPLGNAVSTADEISTEACDAGAVPRHLTALARNSISAPVQLLQRYGYLEPGRTFFDYGCGKGGDINALGAVGILASGWDPYYRPAESFAKADVVNLGFVINVIEDAAERTEALTKAFALTNVVLCVGVMLDTGTATGRPFRDGVLTSRNTFQKYFTQAGFRDYLEVALGRDVFMVGPGIAFVFATSDAEQRFIVNRYRRRGISRTLTRVHQIHRPRSTVKADRLLAADALLNAERQKLESLWTTTLELGRYPELEEVLGGALLLEEFGSVNEALRRLRKHFDLRLLEAATRVRADELSLTLAMQRFDNKAPFQSLERRLQRDIKAFFGTYRTAQDAGLRLLQGAADPNVILDACQKAASAGLGYLDGTHSLQIHISLVERLPSVLRLYISCGLRLWDSVSDVQLVKIHIVSGKLSLMEYEDFDTSPLPRLRRRIKVFLRRLDYQVFDYGSAEYPMPLLYRKSQYLHEEYPGYAEQQAFDEALDRIGVPGDNEFGPTAEVLARMLEAHRLRIAGSSVAPSVTFPDLDTLCGTRITYRELIECGETRGRLGLQNLPLNVSTYNALYALAVNVLDPVIDYFGSIRITYGFSSPELSKQIRSSIAPKLDQHSSCEHSARGKLLCERGGAACDFIVDDEAMDEVAQWIIDHTPFDRLYYYGADRPIHVSYSDVPSGLAFMMIRLPDGKLMPRPFYSGGRVGRHD
ncbi:MULTISPECIES: DNA phosphorothioation-associated putative methyltransferase [unclassified Caballeronia]|uniref:DNA phosphorothioation-associated putative methyltransferase n=1 Tax=unclassified Caballeronia TaxID=2646786 RepID=UPI002028F898|nr:MULTISPECIES: DNA phosphorothioation-associated putative methyltransferase [unclassified Caballeronia]